MPELLSGQGQVIFTSAIFGMPYVKSGKGAGNERHCR